MGIYKICTKLKNLWECMKLMNIFKIYDSLWNIEKYEIEFMRIIGILKFVKIYRILVKVSKLCKSL